MTTQEESNRIFNEFHKDLIAQSVGVLSSVSCLYEDFQKIELQMAAILIPSSDSLKSLARIKATSVDLMFELNKFLNYLYKLNVDIQRFESIDTTLIQ